MLSVTNSKVTAAAATGVKAVAVRGATYSNPYKFEDTIKSSAAKGHLPAQPSLALLAESAAVVVAMELQ